MKKERDPLYLIFILECIERIEKYMVEGREVFIASNMVQDAVLRNLHLLADASQFISRELKSNHKEVKWRHYAGLRNLLVHEYLGLDVRAVWAVIVFELPILKEKIQKILNP